MKPSKNNNLLAFEFLIVILIALGSILVAYGFSSMEKSFLEMQFALSDHLDVILILELLYQYENSDDPNLNERAQILRDSLEDDISSDKEKMASARETFDKAVLQEGVGFGMIIVAVVVWNIIHFTTLRTEKKQPKDNKDDDKRTAI